MSYPSPKAQPTDAQVARRLADALLESQPNQRGFYYAFVFDRDPAPLPVNCRYKNAYIFRTQNRLDASCWIQLAAMGGFEVTWGRSRTNPIASKGTLAEFRERCHG